MTEQKATAAPPFVSIIMPIRNEAKFIAKSLGSVLDQDYPADRMEVLIADGMSDDDTRRVIQDLIRQRPQPPVTVIDNPGRIVPKGLNRALAQAQGEIIIRMDGHALVERDYVTACVQALHTTGADNVGGRTHTLSDTEVGQAIAQAMSSPFGVGGAVFRYAEQDGWVDTLFPGAWPRSVFERIGTFDEELVRNQDDEFNYRLRAAGGKIWLSHSIRAEYYSRSTLAKLWSQYFQYGFWKVRVLQKHPLQMRPRQFAPPMLVSVLLGGLLLAPFSAIFAWLWVAALVVYLTAIVAAALITARKLPFKVARWLPIIFPVLHLSYGLGFLWGLVKFANRWGRTVS